MKKNHTFIRFPKRARDTKSALPLSHRFPATLFFFF